MVGGTQGGGVTSKEAMRRTPRPHVLLLAAGLVVVLLAAACGDDDQATRTTGDPADDRGGDPDGDDDLLITLDVHGGFVPVERAVADTADTAIVGDGTVLSPAPTIAIFPGPALQTFQVGRVDPEQVADLAEAIEALDPAADYSSGAETQIADAPETTVSVLRGGEVTTSITAYALGMADGTDGPRAELAAVVERINGLVDPGGEELYEPTALRVHDVTEQAGDPPSSSTTAADPELPAEPTGRVLPWPLPHDGRACTIVEDADDVAAALDVLRDATQLDWFATDAGVRRLVAVPVLPGDAGCPDTP